jgi:Zn-dependent M28 family amino/carboxypeptidase
MPASDSSLQDAPLHNGSIKTDHASRPLKRAGSKPISRLIGWFIKLLLLIAISVAGWIAAVIQPFVSPVVSQAPPADAARLQAHVKYLSEDLFPRSADRIDNTERAVQYIYDAFAASGAQVSTQDVMVDGVAYKNVIARFGPADGALIVVGAHYDSHGDEAAGAMHPEGFTADTHTPGADDNASGVAGLIELAGMLGRQPPSQPVELVAYALEEPPYFRTPHMGSVWHARSLATSKREVKLMLSLEMIGYFSDAPDSQNYPVPMMKHLYSERGDFIALVGKFGDFGKMRRAKALMSGASALPVHSINAPALLQGIDFSDHRSYWPHGYPAIMVTDTAFFRNANYHQAGDRYETLDYARMALVVQSVFALVQQY